MWYFEEGRLISGREERVDLQSCWVVIVWCGFVGVWNAMFVLLNLSLNARWSGSMERDSCVRLATCAKVGSFLELLGDFEDIK